jgi:hypothetical protein
MVVLGPLTVAGVKAKPFGRPSAGLDPGSAVASVVALSRVSATTWLPRAGANVGYCLGTELEEIAHLQGSHCLENGGEAIAIVPATHH